MKIRTILHAVFLVVALCISVYFLNSAFASYKQDQKTLKLLKRDVSRLVRRFPGRPAFIIKNISKPHLQISYAVHKPFAAASLIKLPMAAVVGQAIQEGKLSLTQVFRINKADVTSGSGELKTLEMPVTVTLKDLLEKSITKSDNTATNKLISILGYDYFNRGFRRLGLKQTYLVRKMMDFSKRDQGVENFTTAADIAAVLEKIYSGQLISKEYSLLVMEFLKDQKIRDRIPKLLPTNVAVAHKTGLERGVVHDAGIIFSTKGNYLICVLTKKVRDYSTAKRFIAQLSLLTYNNLCSSQ